MSTQANPVAAAPSLSTLQKIGAWFHKSKVTIEADLAKILGPDLATEAEGDSRSRMHPLRAILRNSSRWEKLLASRPDLVAP